MEIEVTGEKTFKQKMKEVMEKGKHKASDVWRWCGENKEAVVIFGPVLIGSAIEFIKIVNRRSTVTEEKRLKENYIYDARHHHYYELKRQPKSSEWLQIDERKDNGEGLYDILQDMRLLK